MGEHVTDLLDSDVAVITGAGRRLGRLYALAMAGEGAKVVVNDLDATVANRVVNEIQQGGGTAVAAISSISDPAGAAAVVDVALDRFGSVDIVVNNAGFMRNAYVEDITPGMFQDVISVNVNGAFYVSQAAWPVMKEKGYGRIVMTSSSGGMFSMAAAANYAAAKAGVYGLMKAFAIEGAPLGIGVNAILPHANQLPDDNVVMDREASAQWHEENWGTPAIEDYLTPGFLADVGRRDPRLVAPLVVYLCSRECTITGEAYACAMGRYSRVFVGEGPGWRRPDDEVPSIDDIRSNLGSIRATEDGAIPWDLHEEHDYMARRDR